MPRNRVALIQLDDAGVREFGCVGEGNDSPPTPKMDALADVGVLFPNGWAAPFCQTSRACTHSGRYSIHHGLGGITEDGQDDVGYPLHGLSTIARVAQRAGARTGYFGKWHMNWTSPVSGWPNAPRVLGFERFAGHISNVTTQGETYDDWTEAFDSVETLISVYNTTRVVDQALSWVGGLTAGEPALCWIGFQAPHKPLHVPPQSLHTQGTPTTARGKYKAMVESADTELGRFITGLGTDLDNWYFIVWSDNGTDGEVLDATAKAANAASAKGTVLEGGINVPIILSEPTHPLGTGSAPYPTSTALVTVVDILPTVAEIFGVDLAGFHGELEFDGTSFFNYLASPSDPSNNAHILSEYFEPSEHVTCPNLQAKTSVFQAVREAEYLKYKVIRAYAGGPPTDVMYDLVATPWEVVGVDELDLGNLTAEQQDAYDDATAFLDGLCPASTIP